MRSGGLSARQLLRHSIWNSLSRHISCFIKPTARVLCSQSILLLGYYSTERERGRTVDLVIMTFVNITGAPCSSPNEMYNIFSHWLWSLWAGDFFGAFVTPKQQSHYWKLPLCVQLWIFALVCVNKHSCVAHFIWEDEWFLLLFLRLLKLQPWETLDLIFWD